jgi:hypothetical protein
LEKTLPADDILLVYKIFYLLINKPEIAEIASKEAFWNRACSFFMNECNNAIGKFIQDSITNINLSCENVLKIKRLVGNDANKITPSYFSKMCGTSGLIAFLLKDTLEYVGIIVDTKKTPPFNLYKYTKYQLDNVTEKLEKLGKLTQAD